MLIRTITNLSLSAWVEFRFFVLVSEKPRFFFNFSRIYHFKINIRKEMCKFLMFSTRMGLFSGIGHVAFSSDRYMESKTIGIQHESSAQMFWNHSICGKGLSVGFIDEWSSVNINVTKDKLSLAASRVVLDPCWNWPIYKCTIFLGWGT